MVCEHTLNNAGSGDLELMGVGFFKLQCIAVLEPTKMAKNEHLKERQDGKGEKGLLLYTLSYLEG